METHRRQNNNTDVEHAFITRRQISDHEENNTQESSEVKSCIHISFYCVLLMKMLRADLSACFLVLFSTTEHL